MELVLGNTITRIPPSARSQSLHFVIVEVGRTGSIQETKKTNELLSWSCRFQHNINGEMGDNIKGGVFRKNLQLEPYVVFMSYIRVFPD